METTGASGAIMADLAWPEAARRMHAGQPVVLPIGAAVKAHGRHLPLGVDKIVVEAICARLAAKLPVLIAPTVGFGFYPAFVEFPPSQHIPARLFEDLLISLMQGFIAQGCTRVLLLNGGVSTEALVLTAAHAVYAETGVRPAMAHLRLFGRSTDAQLDDPSGGHADERETSVMLALRPDLVDLEQARLAPSDPGGESSGGRISQPIRLAHGRAPGAGEASADSATGDPTRATAAKGRGILDATEAELLAEIRHIFTGAPGLQ